MKTFIFSLAMTVAILATTAAQAKSVLVPSFKGHINNYTSIPSDKLVVRVSLECTYSSGFVWHQSKSCGNEEQHVPVNADGTYVVPNMNWQQKSSISKYLFSFSISAASLYPEAITSEFFTGKEIRSASSALKDVSIYETPKMKINVITPTGENYASWRGKIAGSEDACVELVFAIKLPATYQIHGESDLVESIFDTAVPGSISPIYFATKGNAGKDLSIQGSLYYISSKPECLANQSHVKFENGVIVNGSIKEIYKVFMNSSYKVD